MSYRRIIIGDVHGYYDTLLRLFDVLAVGTGDRIYFLGDLIDRGPQSAQVVEFVMQNNYSCVLGNHEQMMLAAVGCGKSSHQLLQAWMYSGGYLTLESYNNQIPQDHIDWLKARPNYLDLGDVWLVHAGVDPQLPLEKQDANQFCWIRDDFHRSDRPFFSDKSIVTGHTMTFTFPSVQPGQLAAGAGWLDIDTGVYHPYSGWLTALDIDSRQVYQVHGKTHRSRILPLDDIAIALQPEEVTEKIKRQTLESCH
jgi:serine/threonine protein phosphatase 1